MCDIFSFFKLKVCTCSFGKKNKTDQSFSLLKIFLLYDDNGNQVSGQLSPRKIAPPVRVRVWISVRVRVRAGGQFSLGVIVLELVNLVLID